MKVQGAQLHLDFGYTTNGLFQYTRVPNVARASLCFVLCAGPKPYRAQSQQQLSPQSLATACGVSALCQSPVSCLSRSLVSLSTFTNEKIEALKC